MRSPSRFAALAVTIVLAAAPAPASAPSESGRAALARAADLVRGGDVRAARAQVQAAVKADPDWALAYAMRGRTALGILDGAAAEPDFRRAVDLGYPEADLRHLMAQAFLLQGRPRAALELADPRQMPARYGAYAARVRSAAFSAIGDPAGAVGALAYAAQIAPGNSRVWSDIARLRVFGGDVAGAQAAARHAVELDPNNVDALVLSGNMIRDQYGLSAALPWYDRALQAEPGNLAAMLERAATLGDACRTREMLAQTRAVLAAFPNNPQAYYLQAVMAARADDWALARGLLYRVGDRLGDLAGVRLLGALAELNQGSPERAIAQLRLLADAQPDNIKVRRLLGAALWRSGDDRGAIEMLRPLADRPDADGYSLTVIGRALEHAGSREEATEYLDRAAAPARGAATPFDGSDAHAPLDGGISVPYIRTLLRAGQNGEAIAQALRMRAQNPRSPAAALLVGDTYYAQRNYAAAADAYASAADIVFSENAALRLIDALRRSANYTDALRVLDLYRAQNPLSVAAALLASDVYLARGDWGRAERLLESLRRRIGARDATLLNNLAWAKLHLGRVDDAVALGRAAYRIAPGNAPVAASLGWFLAREGDRKGGAALLEKAVALAPLEPAYKVKLAQVRGS